MRVLIQFAHSEIDDLDLITPRTDVASSIKIERTGFDLPKGVCRFQSRPPDRDRTTRSCSSTQEPNRDGAAHIYGRAIAGFPKPECYRPKLKSNERYAIPRHERIWRRVDSPEMDNEQGRARRTAETRRRRGIKAARPSFFNATTDDAIPQPQRNSPTAQLSPSELQWRIPSHLISRRPRLV
jgi:hypothetical protein